MTSAHVVSGGKFIEVQKENDSKKYDATVKYISNQIDLAILDFIKLLCHLWHSNIKDLR